MEQFLPIIFYTLVLTALYTLIGSGFALRSLVAKYLDIGYSVYMTLGAYFFFVFSKYIGSYGILVAVLITATFAYLCEKFYFAKLIERKSSPLVIMIASLGLMILVQAIIAMIFTSNTQVLHTTTEMWQIFGTTVLSFEVIAILSTVLFVIIINLLLNKSKLGTQIRAIGDNKLLAETAGLPVKKISLMIAFVSGGIAALAGIFYGLSVSINPLMGMSLLLSGITAAIMVNMQNVGRVYWGALILASLQNAAVFYFGGEWKDVVTFLILIGILLVRPKGLSDTTSVRTA